ncbi:MAG TPA: hypothetical protein PK651_06675, partial [Smithellaceae bacterium]|nr:hypothetical protein [Smithellaceae bacterium]
GNSSYSSNKGRNNSEGHRSRPGSSNSCSNRGRNNDKGHRDRNNGASSANRTRITRYVNSEPGILPSALLLPAQYKGLEPLSPAHCAR